MRLDLIQYSRHLLSRGRGKTVFKKRLFTWIGPDKSIRILPPRLVEIQCLEEDEKHSSKKSGQEGVQDDVEQENFGCKFISEGRKLFINFTFRHLFDKTSICLKTTFPLERDAA